MNVNSASSQSSEIKKKLFNLKTIRKDGLILQIHHTVETRGSSKRIRFLYSVFDNSGLISANADIDGNIFVIDFSCNKFWSLPKLDSCSVLAFSTFNSSDLIIGCNDGSLYIVNVHLGYLNGVLQGHQYPVKHISFANEQCLTASLTEAIIFNLQTFNKIHELSLESSTSLKQIFFMPVTHHILACFSDDYIHVWKHHTFESFKKLLPTEWNKFHLKSIAVTRNGTTMILAGLSPKLIVFSLDSWTLIKILNLPEDMNVKAAEFVSLSHDGGANKFLILLANNGTLNFLNMELSLVTARIQLEREIISFCCSSNGLNLSCVLKGGEVNVYKLANFVENPVENCDRSICDTDRRKLKLFSLSPKPKEGLDLNKLQGILKEFGEYPETYRSLIWSKILVLPNNLKSFAAINAKGYNTCFNYVEKKYPLANKNVLKNLKKLLSNLGNWCSMFCHVEFLPLFVFPFVKIFENDPVICYEAVMTIILNWCQHWFEYSPVPPMNILAIIENVLAEHDAQLLAYLTDCSVTSHLYAWSLLEVAFSEVLTIKEWCILWDHILSNEPAFMLMIPVAYNILSRSLLATLKSIDEFEIFYHNQNPIGIKKIVNKTYYLLNNTNEARHPRRYLKDFTKLTKGSYPIFEEHPKVQVEYEKQSGQENEQASDETISKVENEILKYKEIEQRRQQEVVVKQEEAKRVQQLEDMYQEKLIKEKEQADKRKLQLSKLKTNLLDMQAESLEKSRKQVEEINLNDRKRELDKMLKTIEYNQTQDDIEIQQTEEDLSKHYVELLKQKTILENMLLESVTDDSILPEKFNQIEEQRKNLNSELDEMRKNVNFNRIINKVSIPIGVTVANDKIKKIDMTLAKEMAQKQEHVTRCNSTMQIIKMENDTKELENDIESLLDKFTNLKKQEAINKLYHLSASISERQHLFDKEKQFMTVRNELSNENFKFCPDSCSKKCCSC